MNPLKKSTTWIIAGLLFLLFQYMGAIVLPNVSASLNEVAENAICAVPLDLKVMGITKEKALNTLSCMGTEGRKIYRQAETREDIIYPISYGMFFSFILFSMGAYGMSNRKVIWTLAVLPFIVTCMDLGENYHIVKLIDQFPELDEYTIDSVALFNTLKWCGLFLTFTLVAFIALWNLARMMKRKSTAS